MLAAIIVLLICILAAGLITVSTSIRVLREYERGVIFRLGRVMDQKGPGVIFLRPGLDRMVRVSLRTVTLQIPAQEVITRDNVPARVTAVAYYRVIDSTKSVIEIENVLTATEQVAQTTLRSVLGKAELDSLLSERETLNEQLQHIIDEQTEPWGVKVMTVEIKDVEIPERMQHAMARQAEAERERRAKIINAEGEFQAAARLNDAADVISRNPVTIQLRNLQTLIEVSNNQSSTIVFPLPMDVLGPLISASKNGGRETGQSMPSPESTPSAELTPAPESMTAPELAPAPESMTTPELTPAPESMAAPELAPAAESMPAPEFDAALAAARVALEQAREENPAPRVLTEATPPSPAD